MATDPTRVAGHEGAVLERVTRLREAGGAPRPLDVARHAREVVLIGSSSRGGSSIFAEVLRRSRGLLHFRAEINPFLRLHGVAGTDSDAVAEHEPVPEGLGLDLGWDCGQPTRHLDDAPAVWGFAVEIAVRLTLQWPALRFDLDVVHDAVQDVLIDLVRHEGWPAGRFLDPQPFHARLLARVRRRLPEIHPGAYDLDRRLVAALCPGPYPGPRGPDGAGVFVPDPRSSPIEEPPFVLVTPWRLATEAQLDTCPLVIKTPSNAYRVAWLRRLFAAANVRVLHLVRNVAASVNGLYDGWRYPGFHAHATPAALDIRGYTGVVRGGDVWWKFDRPPGWTAYTGAPLEQVCAFQWRSAHAALLATAGLDRFRLRFEDVLGPAQRQRPTLVALGRWLGVPVADELAHVLAGALPVVMATEQPRSRRWFDRIALLGPLLAEPAHQRLMEALGYDADPETWE